ncbi:MAG: valine--tRNA ligase, partial [Oscillospiraceae bacterium]|nr:valine--tRNA ligase [Oscillospiraceae bacterium]
MDKRYDFTKVEKQIQDFWEQGDFFRFDKNASGDIYSIDTPPPTVSGSLHIGHLFSYTQAEMIARFRRMQGQNVFYPFGFDDNGLPTERLVEREEGIRAGALPRGEFVEKCLGATQKYEDGFKAFWSSLGFSVDWSTTYRTISPEVVKISQRLFLELAEAGKAYTKESPVLWCVECGTSIAQAELDAVDVEGTYVHVPFHVAGRPQLEGADRPPLEGADRPPLEVATTRPELLYGCVCLFVNPADLRYRDYIGLSATVPLYGHDIPILADDGADMEKGTGVVMCATFGDSADAEWHAKHKLPYRRAITPDGRIAAEAPYIGGMEIQAARTEIIRLLGERGLKLKSETITHAVGAHERCGRTVEIIPSRQWYIEIMSGRDQFLNAADEINWYPPSMKNRYTAWVENLKWDWCISRQRYFGVPFPVWYCADCGAAVFASEEQLPVNPLETVYAGACAGCGCTRFVPEGAVFDTWATSSVTPQINERLGLKLTPMGMRTHAHEIIRTWTFYTIVRSLYHTGAIPWKDLMICGFILAKRGEKISKSKGEKNDDMDPERLIAAHSADALRYWTAGARLGSDTFFSEGELAIPKRFITKLWNAARFAQPHLEGMYAGAGSGEGAVAQERGGLRQSPELQSGLLPIDRWIIERAHEACGRAAKLLYEYEIGAARHEIDRF